MEDEPVIHEESNGIKTLVKDKQVIAPTIAPVQLQSKKPEPAHQNQASEDDPLKLEEDCGSDDLMKVIGE